MPVPCFSAVTSTDIGCGPLTATFWKIVVVAPGPRKTMVVAPGPRKTMVVAP